MKLNKAEFQKLAKERGADVKKLKSAVAFMEQLRSEGYTVKRQEVKDWYGVQTPATHNRGPW